MIVNVCSYSSVGKRENNEDMLKIADLPNGFLAVLCDGMGGHENGEFASRKATEAIYAFLINRRFSGENLEDAVIFAHIHIVKMQELHPNAMTTVAALWINKDKAFVVNAGDTRIYQFRGNQVYFQSDDHSMAQLAVISGEISKQEIRNNKSRNRLYRFLGGETKPRITAHNLTIQAGDRFLLCTDGFWETITEEQMIELSIEQPSVEAWLKSMRTLVQKKARDNNTAIVLEINSTNIENLTQ